jgi:hypothetical protein
MGPWGGEAGRPLDARRVRRLLFAAALALFALRLVLSLARTGPLVFADEAGYLGDARLLGGGMDFFMGSSPFYRAGYSLLITPLIWLGADPRTTYNLVLVVNAALAAAMVPLLYLLLTRCFDVARPIAIGAAIAGAAYPSVTTLSQAAMSENALFPLTVVWVLAFATLLTARGRAALLAGLGTGACAGALWIVHGRMIVALAVTALALLGLAARRRIDVGGAIAGLAAIGVGLVVGHLLNDFVITHNYDGRSVDEISSSLGQLDHVGAFLSVARNLIGESWYVLVASFGLIGLVVLVDGRATATKLRDRVVGVRDLSLSLLLVTALGLLVVTAVWFVDPTRPDELLYGRYVEPVVPPLLALGVVAVARRPSASVVRTLLGALAVLTVIVAALEAGADLPEGATRWAGAGLPFFTDDLGPGVIVGAGIVAAAGLLLIVEIAGRTRTLAWVAAAALFVPVIAFSEIKLALGGQDEIYPAGWESPQATVEARSDEVAFDVSDFDRIAAKAYQWFLPNTRWVVFDSTTEDPPTPLFFSGKEWARRHPGTRATIVWRDPGRDQVLWQSPLDRP